MMGGRGNNNGRKGKQQWKEGETMMGGRGDDGGGEKRRGTP
jgi:hypothetical protein